MDIAIKCILYFTLSIADWFCSPLKLTKRTTELFSYYEIKNETFHKNFSRVNDASHQTAKFVWSISYTFERKMKMHVTILVLLEVP